MGANSKWNIIRFEAVASTNDYLHQLIDSGQADNLTVVIANHQTKGRGHGDNSWESEEGLNLTCSLLYLPKGIAADLQFCISQAISIGLVKLLEETTSRKFIVKWPNDIFYGDKKVAGILIENTIIGNMVQASIIGIGLNVNQVVFRSSAPNPISIRQIINKPVDLNMLFDELLRSVSFYFEMLDSSKFEAIHTSYLDKLYRLNEWYNFESDAGRFRGMIIGISDYGELIIKNEREEQDRYLYKTIKYID